MKFLKSFLLLVFVASTVVSCDNDDDNGSSASGEFVYDGATYSLNKGSLIDFGGSSDLYNFDITLGSPSIEFDSFGDIDGTGDAVYFELWTNMESGLKSGRYNYNFNEADFVFTIGNVGVDCNTTTDNCTFEGDVSSGTVDINRSGSNYDISFNLVLSNGETVTGSYDGPLSSFTD